MQLVDAGILLAKGVLILFSLASIAVMVERVISLRRSGRLEQQGYDAAREALASGQSAEAVRNRIAGLPGPSLVALRDGVCLPAPSEERLREAVGLGILLQTTLLQRNLSYLATIASTAPYIGLFGTVLGILSAFRRIAATGDTGPGIVAGGISEALIATAIGLGVAIPAVIAYNQLLNRVNSLSLTVETHALDLVARYAALPAALASVPTPPALTAPVEAQG